MQCDGSPAKKFGGVSLANHLGYYGVQKYEVVNGNNLRRTFEKDYSNVSCIVVKEVSHVPPATAPAPE